MSVFPKWLLILIFTGIALFVGWYFSNLIICILLAGVLSLISKPVSDFYKKIKIGKYTLPSSIAAIITIASLLFVVSSVFALIIPLVVQQVKVVSNIDLNKVLNDLREPIGKVELLLHRYNIIETENQSLKIFLQNKLSHLITLIDIPSLLQSLFQTAGNFFFIFFTTLFILFFFLKEENLFLRLVSVFIPDNQNNKLADAFLKVRKMLFRYFIALFAQLSLVAIFVASTLHFLGVKNALLIGLLAGILNIVPYVGPIIGVVVAIILATLAHLACIMKFIF
jgi:predicted PurR-regulated permease PerM